MFNPSCESEHGKDGDCSRGRLADSFQEGSGTVPSVANAHLYSKFILELPHADHQ